jgi:hypothetical protein
MREAIKIVFDKSQHRNCRWHIIRMWGKLVDECGIGEHPAIVALWQKRKRWIATYFKGMYCGRITSTQRSESQNKVLKGGYVGSVTTVHMFAKRVLDSIQHTDHMNAGESHYSQVF